MDRPPGIGDGEVFPEAIRRAIEESDAFLFVVTPESVASRYCESEVDYAVSLHPDLLRVSRLARVSVIPQLGSEACPGRCPELRRSDRT